MHRKKFWKFLKEMRRMLFLSSLRNLLRKINSTRNCLIFLLNLRSSTHLIILILMILIMILNVLWKGSSHIFQKLHSNRNSLKKKWSFFKGFSFSLRFFVKEVVNKLRIIFGNKLRMISKRKSKRNPLTSLNYQLLNWKDFLLTSKFP
jgi:hypothetical protein